MKTNLSSCALAITLALGGFHPVAAEPFNEGGKGLEFISTRVVPAEPVRYNTVLYNARYSKRAEDQTPLVSSFNDRPEADLVNSYPRRFEGGRGRINCEVMEMLGFNNRDMPSC